MAERQSSWNWANKFTNYSSGFYEAQFDNSIVSIVAAFVQ